MALEDTKGVGLLSGFTIVPNSLSVLPHFCVDYVLVLGEQSRLNIDSMVRAHNCFYIVPNLNISCIG